MTQEMILMKNGSFNVLNPKIDYSANLYQNWSKISAWYRVFEPPVATGETHRPMNGTKICGTKFKYLKKIWLASGAQFPRNFKKI